MSTVPTMPEDPTGIGGPAVGGIASAGVDGAHFLVAHVPGDRGQDAADHDAENPQHQHGGGFALLWIERIAHGGSTPCEV